MPVALGLDLGTTTITALAVEFDGMNRLAAAVPPGSDGLRCSPLFTGTRADPTLRGALTGLSAENFTPGHVARALLKAMAAIFHEGYLEIAGALGGRRSQLVGAGNGLRQNDLLAEIVADAFGLPIVLPRHQEEAALGAAWAAAVGPGLLPDQRAAARLIQYA